MLAQFQLPSAMLSLALFQGVSPQNVVPFTGGCQRPMAIFDDGGGATLFVAVSFEGDGGPATRLLKWTGREWQQVGPLLDGKVLVLCAYAGELYAGGELLFPPHIANLAKWDGCTWSAVGIASTPDGAVETLVEFEGRLYVGGAFHRIGRRPADHHARWDGTTWEGLLSRERALRKGALPDPTTPPGPRPEGIFYDLERFGPALRASWFAASSQGILRWNGASWTKIASVLFGEARGLVAWRGHLYAAATSEIRHPGALTTVYGNLARFDGQHWQSMPDAPAGPLYTLAVGPDDQLYVGGLFSRVGKTPANNIARFDGRSWSPVGDGLPGRVNALALHQERLHASGHFERSLPGGSSASFLARLENDAWNPLGRPVDRPQPRGKIADHRVDMASLLPMRPLRQASA